MNWHIQVPKERHPSQLPGGHSYCDLYTMHDCKNHKKCTLMAIPSGHIGWMLGRKPNCLSLRISWWLIPRGGSLFKISRPCWALTFWLFAEIIIRVGVLNGSHGFDWAQNNSWASFGALGRFSYVISISLLDHVPKPWPNQKNVMFILLFNV